jgi:hypothetical protein
MTRDDAISILLDNFSAGLVRTLEDAIAKKEREACIETIRLKLGRGKRDEYYQAQKDMILLLESRGKE